MKILTFLKGGTRNCVEDIYILRSLMLNLFNLELIYYDIGLGLSYLFLLYPLVFFILFT